MKLIEAYSEYLKSNRAVPTVPALVQALKSNGLSFEAEILNQFYFNDCKPVEFEQKTGVYAGHRVVISEKTLARTKEGVIWVDPVELTPYYYSKETATAFATHPAYFWQYAGFLQALKCELPDYNNTYFSSGMLKMDMSRFEKLREMDFVTNVFCDESITYSYWFGKRIMTVNFQLLKEELSADLFDQMFPAGLCFWVGYATNDESYRLFSNLEIEKEDRASWGNSVEEVYSAEEDRFALPENKSTALMALSSCFFQEDLMDYGQYTNVDLRAKILNQAPRFLK